MFTVKVRAANGVESIYSAEKIEVVPIGPSDSVAGASNWDKSGIFLDPDVVPLEPGNPESPRAAKEVILFGGDHTEAAKERMGGRVWVMNEAGATVATYEL